MRPHPVRTHGSSLPAPIGKEAPCVLCHDFCSSNCFLGSPGEQREREVHAAAPSRDAWVSPLPSSTQNIKEYSVSRTKKYDQTATG